MYEQQQTSPKPNYCADFLASAAQLILTFLSWGTALTLLTRSSHICRHDEHWTCQHSSLDDCPAHHCFCVPTAAPEDPFSRGFCRAEEVEFEGGAILLISTLIALPFLLHIVHLVTTYCNALSIYDTGEEDTYERALSRV